MRAIASGNRRDMAQERKLHGQKTDFDCGREFGSNTEDIEEVLQISDDSWHRQHIQNRDMSVGESSPSKIETCRNTRRTIM
jgi:hypothetical protein